MVCSGFAILISIFNMVMCAQNEFDPIILEKELLDRRQHAAKKQKRLDAIEQSSKDKNDAPFIFSQNFSFVIFLK